MDPNYPNPYPYPHPYPYPPQSAPPGDTNQQRAPYLQSCNSLPSQFNPNAYPPPPNYYKPYPHNPNPYPYPYPHQAPYNSNPNPNPNPTPLNYNPADHLAGVSISDPAAAAPSSPYRSPPHVHLTPSHYFSSSHHGPPPPRPSASNIQMVPYGAIPPQNSPPFGGSQNAQIVPYAAGGSQHGRNNSMQMVPVGGSSHGGSKVSLKVLLLHGSLDIWVCEARYLPNMDMFSKRIGDMLGKRLSSLGKLDHLSSMTSDPYVSIVVGDAVVGRTYVVQNSEHPVWMQHFNVPVAHYAAEIEFLIKDSDIVGSQLIGSVMIPAVWIYTGERVEGIYPVLGTNGKPCKPGATLRISMKYFPIHRLSMYHLGVGAGPEYIGVPGTYFPLRKGGRVRLYQDAHVPDGCLPDLKLEYDKHYAHGQCWVDVLEAISQAKRLIYITGWSVFHTVRLVRDAGPGKDIGLGDLLKMKSQEGVRVLLLVWDDPTSTSILGYKMNGIMGTQDEETRRFFKNSSVQVILCPRSAGKKHSWVKQQETGVIFTHHQKTVIVDADAGNCRRKVIAFVGGLDLCGGRYDTPKHPMFRTLKTFHKDDFHQPNFGGPVVNGPREPWHDLHTRIDGPAAYDVLTNFEERWLKAAKRHGIKKLKRSYDDALLQIDRVPEMLGIHESPYLYDTDPETWHVQIFRSIDSNSVKGFPKDPKIATSKNLVCGKNVLIDMSIHTAYVKAIRAAQHFIYIENQYFLGSSYNWDSHKDLGANNLIPIEIALKIANKIKANERFSAYIIIPMWPEGNPTGAATQRILYWQKKTMQMMYETIYKALKEEGLEETYEPQDYLNFFCLGNREALGPEDTPSESPSAAANTPAGLAKKNRRFMIYVHSKGMIVDDEYLIVGSANINQRSLEGTRDTEIAMGAYQPEHTWAKKVYGPRGQIYGYRMSLWAEHIGHLEECYTQPESLECMRRLRELGEMNWKQFAGDDVTDMKGHLLKYPVDVDRKGKVKPLAGCESFPDLGGNICGSFLAIQENLTI